MGALITVLALGADPFVQQLTRYYTCTILDVREQASISRTNTYSDPEGQHLAGGTSSLGIGMQAALGAGSFSASAFSVAFSCPSGNCTIGPAYSSVAFCSRCTDISSEIGSANYTTVDPADNSTIRTLNYTLPSGLYLTPADGGQVFALGGYAPNLTYTLFQ